MNEWSGWMKTFFYFLMRWIFKKNVVKGKDPTSDWPTTKRDLLPSVGRSHVIRVHQADGGRSKREPLPLTWIISFQQFFLIPRLVIVRSQESRIIGFWPKHRRNIHLFLKTGKGSLNPSLRGLSPALDDFVEFQSFTTATHRKVGVIRTSLVKRSMKINW